MAPQVPLVTEARGVPPPSADPQFCNTPIPFRMIKSLTSLDEFQSWPKK